MEFYTVRNTVILALTQVGVIVAGVLAAGATIKWYGVMTIGTPEATKLAVDFGHLALAVPLLWAADTLWRLRRAKGDEEPEFLVFLTGFLLLLVMLAVVWHASVKPLARLLLAMGCGLSA